MKAKEYFAKYESDIMEGGVEPIRDMLLEMSSELQTLQEKRNAQTNRATASIIKELNEKWNAVGNLFEKKYGVSPITPNGFLKFWHKEIPELNLFLQIWRVNDG